MEAQPLSSDQMRKYVVLWKAYGTKQFEFKKAQELLKMNENHLLVTLHRLRQKGWLTTKQHPRNPKKSLYVLVSPNDAVIAIAN